MDVQRAKKRCVLDDTDRQNEIELLSEALSNHQLELRMQQEELDRTSAELEAAQRKFDEIRENAPVPYLIHDSTGFVFEINKRGRELLGLQPCEKNLRLDDFFDQKVFELIEFNQKRIESTHQPASIEFPLKRLGLEDRFVLAEMSIVEKGVFRMVLVDVTSRKATERVEQQLDSKLLHAQKMEILDRLSGGIAHDFNNILQVLVLQTELAKNAADPGNKVVNEAIGQIYETAGRGIELTGRLLAFSRKAPLEKRRVDFNEVVSKCMELVEKSMDGQCALDVQLSPTRLGVLADVVQLEQAILNLCLNARDAMPNGGTLCVQTSRILLDIQTKKSDLSLFPGSYAKISISDEGSGIPSQVISRIFEPYFTTKDVGKGTGLGLSIVHSILRQHYGAIEVVKSDSSGTQFDVFIPAFHLPEIRFQPSQNSGDQSVAFDGTILICDDEPTILSVISESLRNLGANIIAAKDGAHALAAIQSADQIDLLLTDVVMPEADGRSISQACRGKFPDASIIFMSGHGDSVLDREFLREMNATFLAKPFRFENLQEKLGLHLISARSRFSP